MYFCPNCDNVFDITKHIEIKHTGGATPNYDQIVKDIIEEKEEINIDDVDVNALTKSNAYKKLKSRQKEYVYNRVMDLMPLNKKNLEDGTKIVNERAYFKCNNCGYLQKIKNGTLIFRRVSKVRTESYETIDVKNVVHSDILPRTRKYFCTNSNCESHKDPNKKEAVFFRLNNTYRIKYICLACETVIIN